MFSFLCKNLLLISRAGDSTEKIRFRQNPFIRYFSTSTNQPSFTLSYLTNSCGLSQEKAVSVSKKIHLKNSKKPDSVLTLLNNHGFTKSQITSLVYKCPKLLLANPDAILKPKLEFLLSVGFSPYELAKILSSNPQILEASLKKNLIPCIDFLRSVLDSDKNVITVVNRVTWIVKRSLQNTMKSNITVLRDHSVPEKIISMLLKNHPRSLITNPNRFNEIVKDVVEMGFDPFKGRFSQAVYVIAGLSKSSWEEKLEVYKRCGWSKEEIRSAFKFHPNCMMVSEEKIMKTMHFLVNKTCWQSSAIVRCPIVLSYNLEKRIIPRYSVIQVLLSKGLIKKDVSMSTCLGIGDKYFLEKFVTRYPKEVTHLTSIYQGTSSSLGLSGSEQKDGIERF